MRSTGANSMKLANAFILLLVLPACLADLKCYVCDNCNEVTKDTPMMLCNADFFNNAGSTEASTSETTTPAATTTAITMSTVTTPSSTSTTDPTTTTVVTEETTTEELTTNEITTEIAETTVPPPPSAQTIAPVETTTSHPTPADQGSVLNARRRRALTETGYTYHCYTVETAENVSKRGCSRVDSQQAVCTEVEKDGFVPKGSTCVPCSMNACNGATSVLQSSLLVTILLAVVAAAVQRN
ncbi:integumentary mucin C.1 [Drosophila grimshawi]|uniref:GH11594 n=1 Tax=Drosophila grimshawi TaxID=7222 RepID=B4JBX0_DROGR|nr:integumentary mucin C.1 [Drosophila grimshawi]EDW04073.1 GH11594 [Drosophila grimshawi]